MKLRVQSSPTHCALINLPPTKSAQIKRTQCFSLIHVGSPISDGALVVRSAEFLHGQPVNQTHRLRIVDSIYRGFSNCSWIKYIMQDYSDKRSNILSWVLPFSWPHFPSITAFNITYRFPWWDFSFFRVLGTKCKPGKIYIYFWILDKVHPDKYSVAF